MWVKEVNLKICELIEEKYIYNRNEIGIDEKIYFYFMFMFFFVDWLWYLRFLFLVDEKCGFWKMGLEC